MRAPVSLRTLLAVPRFAAPYGAFTNTLEDPMKKTFTAPTIRLESSLGGLTLGVNNICSGSNCPAGT